MIDSLIFAITLVISCKFRNHNHNKRNLETLRLTLKNRRGKSKKTILLQFPFFIFGFLLLHFWKYYQLSYHFYRVELAVVLEYPIMICCERNCCIFSACQFFIYVVWCANCKGMSLIHIFFKIVKMYSDSITFVYNHCLERIYIS